MFLVWVVKNKNMLLMKWLKVNKGVWKENTSEAAAWLGNLDKMMWLKKNKYPWDKNTFFAAVCNGNLTNMMWLKENKCPWDEEACWKGAVWHENLENMVQFCVHIKYIV